MTTHADAVIFGAGVIGSSVAHHLAQRGMDVLVIDRAPSFGAGSTARATGGFRAQFDNETEVRLSLLSREKLLAFEEETGVDPGYRQHGYLFLACGERELDDLRAAQQVQHACGVESTMVGADDVRRLNPAIGDDSIIGGSFCATDGFLRPMSLLRGYSEAAKRNGVRFQFDTELRGLENGVAHTSRGDVHGDVYVNAMGAWAGGSVVPLRRNIAATVPTSILREEMPMTIWCGDWFHLRVRDGRVLLLWPDEPIYEHWLAWVLRLTHKRVPSLANITIDECWTGFYEMTPDGHALLGRSPEHKNVYLATGCSGHGVMHAPALGQLMAEMIVDGATSLDVSALRPERFGSAGLVGQASGTLY